MLNLLQRTTKTGKPIINRFTKLPEFKLPIENRLRKIKSELGYVNNKPNHNQLSTAICTEVTLLNS